MILCKFLFLSIKSTEHNVMGIKHPFDTVQRPHTLCKHTVYVSAQVHNAHICLQTHMHTLTCTHARTRT